MKLAQGQQGEVQGGKWSVEARAHSGSQAPSHEHESEPVGMRAVSDREDDPYRGMSDGEMLEF
jgi:hypothetical protein